ncbi:U6 small nuclear RNA (adenine-(43)-N(6))-methyltransferase [Phthorimaea operculella]|nr:U6 small nuclear RNA (adenine-(43)-N(6))-methyltransferase [Phthorimaea operculella]
MALNKYMHPRNLYRTPPDFAKLAKSYEEFSNIAKTDVTGKVSIDFKNPHCLRVLTKCLLKSDFGLDVVIPEDRLVPTLPLRLNYILWIEDLLTAIGRTDNIKGLDIGTGACAIYPLLAAVKNKWKMVGTESDQESLQKAQENIERNNLQDLIQLSKNSTPTLLEYLFSEDGIEAFDFCMCNPPFYSTVQELCESRSPARLPPKNGFTGSPQELITEGGELAFCRKMIKESQVYKDKVLIFSTMVGHKFNLKELAMDLKAEGIRHTTTEFCQGRVTRWGLAWTYQDYDLDKLVPGRDKLRKKSVPIVYLLPEIKGQPYNFNTVSEKLLDIINKLKLKYKILNKKGNQLSLDIQATENTWSNQRRKRRMMKLQQNDAKKPKLDEGSDTVDAACTTTSAEINNDAANLNSSEHLVPQQNNSGKSISILNKNNNGMPSIDMPEDANKSEETKSIKSSQEPAVTSSSKNSDFSEYLGDNASDSKEPIVHSFFKLLKKDDDILLEMEFLDGTAGKEGVHQIMQYIKNNWK